MSRQEVSGRDSVIPHLLRAFIIPTLLFGLGYGFLSGEYAASLAISATISLTLAIVFALDWHLLRPRLEGLPRDRRLALEIIFACLETILGATLAFLICARVYQFSLPAASVGISIGLVFVMVLIVRTLQYAREFYRDLRKKELLEEQLRALAAEAELKALRAQINPHFLFNTLNTIAALTHSDPARAEQMIERLAEMFRYSLDGSEQRQATLGDEMAFVDVYLEIERARFGERLQVSREIPEEVLEISIPSLILQPLVENAIKHGRTAEGEISLTIHAQLVDDAVAITVADSGRGLPPRFRLGEGTGHGLRNVDERLRKTYGEEWGLEIGANQPQGTAVTVRIPLGERA
jgi:LytS/YehU family sensor histidine kinase